MISLVHMFYISNIIYCSLFHILFIIRVAECAGVCNAIIGSALRKNHVRLYCIYLGQTSQKFRQGIYGGLSCIVAIGCTGEGSWPGKGGGRVCIHCKELRDARGSTNPSVAIDKWGKTIDRCLERREKGTFTLSDADDAKKFGMTPDNLLSVAGRALKQEAKAQVEYHKHLLRLDRQIKVKTYQSIGEESVPGMHTLFKDAVQICEKNPGFEDSLIVALFRAAVAKGKGSANTKSEEIVVNSFRYIQTFCPAAASALSAILQCGPSTRWMKTLNARERKDCILNSGNNDERVKERMNEAIKRRTVGGVSPSFSLAIDATKVSPVLENSSGYMAITGAEHPNELIDIRGLSKEDVREILDGKSKKYGKLPKATEIKVSK